MSEGLGHSLSRLFRSVTTVIQTGTWKVDEAAEATQDAKTILDHVDEEIDERARETTGRINDAMTSFGKLERKVKEMQDEVDRWDRRAKQAADRAKKAAPGSDAYKEQAGLVQDAVRRKKALEPTLSHLKEELEQARPDAEKALDVLQEVGFTREAALSEREVLQVSNATHEARLNLAKATATWQEDGGPGSLLAKAKERVNEVAARADAQEQINDATPPTSEALEAKFARVEAQSGVDDEVAALLGTNQTDVAAPAA